MKLKIEKSLPEGKIYAPASKSVAHRALICAGLCEGESVIENISLSQDIEATLNCLKAIGCEVEIRGGAAKIRGIKNFDFIGKEELFCNESGSTLRFFSDSHGGKKSFVKTARSLRGNLPKAGR